MRTIIIRLAELEQTGGALRGLVEIPGQPPIPFTGDTALLRLITAVVHEPAPRPVGDEPHHDGPA